MVKFDPKKVYDICWPERERKKTSSLTISKNLRVIKRECYSNAARNENIFPPRCVWQVSDFLFSQQQQSFFTCFLPQFLFADGRGHRHVLLAVLVGRVHVVDAQVFDQLQLEETETELNSVGENVDDEAA